MPTYNPLVPTGTVPLNVDYQNLQDNFNQANVVMGVDHLPFDNATAQKGYHTPIHMVPVSTIATNMPNNQPIVGYTATPGYGQLLSAQINDGINADEALYFLTGGNRLIQLTRNFVPVASGNGYTMLPGGIILQWGVVGFTSGDPVVTFPLPFPNDVFSVQVTRQHDASNPGSSYSFWVENNVNKTKFNIINNDSHTWAYNWVAIGN